MIFRRCLEVVLNNRRHSGNLPSESVVAHSHHQKLMEKLMCAVGVLNILRTKMFLKIGKSQFFPSFFDIFAKNR